MGEDDVYSKPEETPEKSSHSKSETMVSSRQEEYLEPYILKDEGYAWVILCAMFASNVLTAGYVKSFGLTSNAIASYFAETSGTMIGIVMGLLTGCRAILAPFSGALTERFGFRQIMSVGIVLSCTGLFSSVFCTSVVQIAITLGAMMGVGLCMIESAQVIIVTDYFDKKLSFANGVRVAGNPVGGMIYPNLLVFLLSYYGFRPTLLILCGIMMHVFICMALMRPQQTRLKKKERREDILESSRHVNSEEKESLVKRNSVDLQVQKTDSEKNHGCNFNLSSQEGANEEVNFNHDVEVIEPKQLVHKHLTKNALKDIDPTTISCEDLESLAIIMTNNSPKVEQMKNVMMPKPRGVEWHYFMDPVYLLFIVMAVGISVGLPSAIFYMPVYGKSIGLTSWENSALLSCQNVFDTLFRVFGGWLTSKKFFTTHIFFVFCLFVGALGIMIIPYTTGFWSLLSAATLYTFCSAGYFSFVVVMLTNQFGKASIASTYGFVRMTQGIFNFIIPPLIGYAVDKTGGYTIPYLTMGFGTIFAAIAMLLEPLVIKLTKSRVVVS